MVASTSIKYFVHTNTNAPQLNNVQGSMIAVLDACLVNGLTLGAVNSMTATGTTVTINFGSAHNLLRFQVVKISGATQAEYNGEHRILSVPTTSSITFEVAIAPSASPATGTILASLPPLGWSLPFTGTGKRAYKNTDLESPYLRVVDAVDPAYTTTYAKYAKVGMVENMTDIDTMTGHQAPYDSSSPNKNWIGTGSGATAYNGWAKWFYAIGAEETFRSNKTTTPSTATRAWIIVGDGVNFYILNRAHEISGDRFVSNGFGKLKNLSKIRANPYFLVALEDYTAANIDVYVGRSPLVAVDATCKLFMYKNHKNESVLAQAGSRVGTISSSSQSGWTADLAAPTAENGVFNTEFVALENGNIPRGIYPIIRWLPQVRTYSHLQTIIDGGLAQLAVNCATVSALGQSLFELGDL